MRTAKATIGSKIKRAIATTLLATTLATSISLSVPANTIKVQAQASEQGHTKKVSMQRKHMIRAEIPVTQYDSQGYSMALSLMQEILRGNKSKIVLDAKDKTVVWGYDRDLAAIQGHAIGYLNLIYFKHYNLNNIEKGGGLTYKYKDPSGLNESYAVITINVSQAKKLYKKNQQIEDKLASIIKACGITNNTTEYEAVRQINKWIATNIEYEYGAGDTNEANNSYQLALTYGSTRCAGYAKLFQVLCDYVGIDSYLVESDSQNHAWNAVSIDNVMYHIDVCWDAGWKNTNIEKWFLLSESEMLKDHGKITYDERSNSKSLKRVPVTFHSINYNLNGGKNNELNPTHYVLIGGKLVSSKFKAPTKKGYIFKGWYSNGKKITTLKQVVGTNPTLTAKWEKLSKPTLKNVKLKKTKTATNTTLKITWKKAENTRYEVKYKVAGSKEKTKTTTKNTLTLKIKAGKKYKVTVRAYKLDSANKKVYSKAKTFTGK